MGRSFNDTWTGVDTGRAGDLGMKKISYSKEVNVLLIELSIEPIAYAEDEGSVDRK